MRMDGKTALAILKEDHRIPHKTLAAKYGCSVTTITRIRKQVSGLARIMAHQIDAQPWRSSREAPPMAFVAGRDPSPGERERIRRIMDGDA